MPKINTHAIGHNTQINYGDIWKQVQNRQRQISEASLELDEFNNENSLLIELKETLVKLINVHKVESEPEHV